MLKESSFRECLGQALAEAGTRAEPRSALVPRDLPDPPTTRRALGLHQLPQDLVSFASPLRASGPLPASPRPRGRFQLLQELENGAGTSRSSESPPTSSRTSGPLLDPPRFAALIPRPQGCSLRLRGFLVSTDIFPSLSTSWPAPTGP